MTKKFLLPGFVTLFIAAIIVFGCSKSGDSKSIDSQLADSKKNNEWPTFTITKGQLSVFFSNITALGTLYITMGSTDWNNPKSGMTLKINAGGLTETLQQGKGKAVIVANDLVLSNNRIEVSVIKQLCIENNNWIAGFEFLRVTPIESKQYPGYLAYYFEACDKNGKSIKNLSEGQNSTEDGEDDYSHPSPPAPPTGPNG